MSCYTCIYSFAKDDISVLAADVRVGVWVRKSVGEATAFKGFAFSEVELDFVGGG